MSEENKKKREPYDPQNTPDPPQRIEPDAVQAQPDASDRQGKDSGPEDKENEKGRPHLLDEETGIDDETTI